MKNEPILELRNITKVFPGVTALDDVSLSFDAGSIHAIVGENGAGKSTLIKIMTGAVRPESGDVLFLGAKLEHNSPENSLDRGISAIYQEFNLFPHLSVSENVFANQYQTRLGVIDFRELDTRCQRILDRLGVHINPRTLVKDLSVGYQQLVEIAKSLAKDLKLLIMDEPSAALTETELEHVFSIVRRLRDEGVTVIYISHRLDEVFSICDRVSVFRDGNHIKTMAVQETSKDELIRLMVNRPLTDAFPIHQSRRGEKVLEVRSVTTDLLENVSFVAYRGERLGFAGLIGAGRTEVARVVFGADRCEIGEVLLHGRKVDIRQPSDAIRHGIALIPEDRKRQGVMLHMSVADNIVTVKLADMTIGVGGYIDSRKTTPAINRSIGELKIKTPTALQLVKNLSGGNQQKVVLAKWLLADCEVIIFDEPTRGIDVGAKQEIYGLINALAEAGKTIIIISSELPELLGMTDRIIVMAQGRVTGELPTAEATQETIMQMSAL